MEERNRAKNIIEDFMIAANKAERQINKSGPAGKGFWSGNIDKEWGKLVLMGYFGGTPSGTYFVLYI
jgi:hypothetical protein